MPDLDVVAGWSLLVLGVISLGRGLVGLSGSERGSVQRRREAWSNVVMGAGGLLLWSVRLIPEVPARDVTVYAGALCIAAGLVIWLWRRPRIKQSSP